MEDPNTILFTKNLKFLRKQYGIKQEELGAEIGVNRNVATSYERGTMPKFPALISIAKFFSVTIDDLLMIDLEKASGTNEYELHSKFRVARELIGLKQSEVAELNGINQNDVSRLENGKRQFAPMQYITFLSENGIDVSMLFNSTVSLENFRVSGYRRGNHTNSLLDDQGLQPANTHIPNPDKYLNIIMSHIVQMMEEFKENSKGHLNTV
jgi:transcriptional regulator with XRE-family HTH domain